MCCVCGMPFLCGSTLVKASLLQAGTIALWPQMFKSDVKPKQTNRDRQSDRQRQQDRERGLCPHHAGYHSYYAHEDPTTFLIFHWTWSGHDKTWNTNNCHVPTTPSLGPHYVFTAFIVLLRGSYYAHHHVCTAFIRFAERSHYVIDVASIYIYVWSYDCIWLCIIIYIHT